MSETETKKSYSIDIDSLHHQLQKAQTARDVINGVLRFLAGKFTADYISLSINLTEYPIFTSLSGDNKNIATLSFGEGNFDNEKGSKSSEQIFSLKENFLIVENQKFDSKIFINDCQAERVPYSLVNALLSKDTKSFCAIPLMRESSIIGWIEIHYRKTFYRFQKTDVFYLDIASHYTVLYLEKVALLKSSKGVTEVEPENFCEVTEQSIYRQRLLEARQQYGRLLQYGNLFIVQTDQRGVVTSVVGDTEKIFGVSPGELISDLGVWDKFVPARDLRSLLHLVRNGIEQRQELQEEIRVVNQQTKEIKRLLIRGIPLFSTNQEFLGWEGYAVDITDKHKIQEEAEAQRKRLSALYDISQSLSVSMEPSVLLLKGLRAMMKATNADCGLAVMYHKSEDELEIVATEGLSSADVVAINSELPREALYRSVLSGKKGMLVSGDTVSGSTKGIKTSIHDMRGAILAPLVVDDLAIGIIALYSKKSNRFSSQDLDVAEVATKQTATILRQAEFYQTERRNADALAFLYRLSHAVSQCLSPQEIAESAFPIIQEEIPAKRMWLGVINDLGTIIQGQSAIGPGMRTGLVKVQIELGLQHDFLDRALQTMQPVIFTYQESTECSGLNKILQRLQIGTIVIIPLTALGQLVGTLVIEPVVSSVSFLNNNINLFSSIGAELGSLILARRFESRIAEAEKMRMASLFAAGVAHNFNNMLQAIMGQASLIELQVEPGTPIAKAAKIINDAVSRGASLVQQLKGFTASSATNRNVFNAYRMINESKVLYQSLVGNNVHISYDLNDTTTEVYADEGQIQRVITNILINAKEAFYHQPNPKILIKLRKENLRSGEVHPEIAPGKYIAISFTDNGIGIKADKLDRIFEPFFTTKNVDASTGVGLSGSGLGLSSSYNIMKQNEGIITAESEEGKGATFTIYIPCAKAIVKDLAESSNVFKNNLTSQIAYQYQIFYYGIDNLTSNSIHEALNHKALQSINQEKFEEILQSLKTSTKTAVNKLVVIDADTANSHLGMMINSIKEIASDIKIILFCIDSNSWSSTLSHIGPINDLEIIEKSLGVWSLQSAIKRMLGLRRTPTSLESNTGIQG